MTVEGLIELLKEKYPQAIVLIEVPWRIHEEGAVLAPIRIQPKPRSGCVYIICKEHKYKRR